MLKRPEKRNQDRRIKTRHRASNLSTVIRRRNLLTWFEKPQDVQCVDINRYGMAFETTNAFKLRERVSIAFSGKYISNRDIWGVVVSRTEIEDGAFRYGVRFSYCTHSKSYSRDIDNALSRIELIYNSDRQTA